MKPAAHALRTRGLRAYDVQKYPEAIDAFRAGYQLDPRPEFLYALAQALRLNGDYSSAIDAYRAFLRSGPPALQAASARKNITRCEALLASLPEPSPAPAIPPPVAEPATPPPPPRHWTHDTPGHVLLALGLAGLVTGGALWGVAQRDLDAANNATRYDQFVLLHAAAGNAEDQRIGGIVSLSLGGALVIASLIHYAVWTRGR